MLVETYSVSNNKIVHTTSVDFTKRNVHSTIQLVQYDSILPLIKVELLCNDIDFVLPENSELRLRWKKRDGTYVIKQALGCTEDRTAAYFEVDNNMTAYDGIVEPIVELQIDSSICGTAPFTVSIARNPIQNGDIESIIDDETAREYAYKCSMSASLSQENADKAIEAANNAKNSADIATTAINGISSSVSKASASASNAQEAANTASTAATNSKASETSALASANSANDSATKAKESETNAKNSENTVISAKSTVESLASQVASNAKKVPTFSLNDGILTITWPE